MLALLYMLFIRKISFLKHFTNTPYMSTSISSIIIVGGGTAGWISAAFLNRALKDKIQITVVEAPTISRIGVGEATIPTIRRTFETIGLNEAEWMRECNATFKLGVKFVDWYMGPNSQEPDTFFHPFFPHEVSSKDIYEVPWFDRMGQGYPFLQYWMQHSTKGVIKNFSEMAGPMQGLCEAKKSARPLLSSNKQNYDIDYAYHLDATLVTDLLKRVAMSAGVKYQLAEIEHVQQDEQGAVKYLVSTEGQRLEADLYIDCSGFRSILIGKCLKEPFRSSSDSLLCDSAIAMRCESNSEKNGINPFTTATALSSGWAWEVPLFNREGTGYVFSSQFLSPDQAEEELSLFLGEKSRNGEPNHLKMRVGRHERSWVKNVVAIGLASSFVEPLESTTIFFIEHQLYMLFRNFPKSRIDTTRAKAFNEATSRIYDDIRDFIVLHYILSKRTDSSFWRSVRSESVIPDSLSEKIEAFKSGVLVDNVNFDGLFDARSYACILSGMGLRPGKAGPMLDLQGVDTQLNFERTSHIAKNIVRNSPSHFDYLRELHNRY